MDLKCHTPNPSNSNRSNSVGSTSIGLQTEMEKWDTQTDSQLTASMWSTEFAIAEFEQQNKNLLIELKHLKISLNGANRSRANA